MTGHKIIKVNRLATPVFVFDDYVDYLRAWYDYARRYRLTQSAFIKQAGVGTQAYFSDVLARRKKLALTHIEGFISALELSGDAACYFSLLVHKAHARKGAEKEQIHKKLALYREKNLTAVVSNKHAEYFSSWRYPLIREYIASRKYVASLREISRAFLHCSIPLVEIRRAVNKLIAWNMIVHDTAKGGFLPAGPGKTVTYSEMPHAVVNDVKRFFIESSAHAMETMPKSERHISMAVRGIDRKTYESFCRKIDDLRKEFLDYKCDSGADYVYALNVQLFPLMKCDPEKNEMSIEESDPASKRFSGGDENQPG